MSSGFNGDILKSAVTEICDDLLLESLNKGSQDNMTAILLMFNCDGGDKGIQESNLSKLQDNTPEMESINNDKAITPTLAQEDALADALRPAEDTPEEELSQVPTRRKLFEQI